MQEIRFGILGCGIIADWHAKAIQATEGSVLAGVADVRAEAAASFAEKYGTHAYASPAEMLQDETVDAVCICTPSGFHCENALQAMEAGKHVLIEKPLSITVEDCDKLIAKAKEKGVCGGVIFQRRFSPAAQEVRQILQEGKLGKLISADLSMRYFRSQAYYDSSSWRGTWKLDGGSLMNQGIHGVDLLLYLVGPVKSLSAYARTLAHEMEAEDTTAISVEFENGALGIVQSSTAVYQGFPCKMVLSGTKGCLVMNDDEIIEYIAEGEPDRKAAELGAPTTGGFSVPTNIDTAGHEKQIDDFANAIREGREPKISLTEGRRTVEFINAVYESSRTQKPYFFKNK